MDKINPIIKSEFTNKFGEHFENVREVAYPDVQGFLGFGEFIAESGKNDDDFEIDEFNGVYVYRSTIDPTKAYRIYKEFIIPNFNGYKDEYFISKLQNKQSKIKLSKLPTGVVTKGGRVIGQELMYCEGETLKSYSLNPTYKILPTKIYIQILNIIKELYINGVFYIDIHTRNFMINKNGIVNAIDFEKDFVKIDELLASNKDLLFNYIGITIQELNENFKIDEKFELAKSFDEYEYNIKKLEKKLI